MKWKPIETAPKNGEFMILASHGIPWPAYGQADGVYSRAHGKVNDPSDRFSLKVTHWMPMPEPPTGDT